MWCGGSTRRARAAPSTTRPSASRSTSTTTTLRSPSRLHCARIAIRIGAHLRRRSPLEVSRGGPVQDPVLTDSPHAEPYTPPSIAAPPPPIISSLPPYECQNHLAVVCLFLPSKLLMLHTKLTPLPPHSHPAVPPPDLYRAICNTTRWPGPELALSLSLLPTLSLSLPLHLPLSLSLSLFLALPVWGPGFRIPHLDRYRAIWNTTRWPGPESGPPLKLIKVLPSRSAADRRP